MKDKSASELNTVELTKVRKQLERLNSFKYQFLISLVRGVGIAIGTTLIAGLVLSLLARFVSSAQFLPETNRILEKYRQ